MKNVLYVVANPFSYIKRSVGGNISSGTGVIKALINKGYRVDLLSDSLIPSLESESKDLRYVRFFLRSIRYFFFNRKIFNPDKLIWRRLESYLFRIDLYLSALRALKLTKYDMVYMRASFHGHAACIAIRNRNLICVLEVNKPLSMATYNNDQQDLWPEDVGQVAVSRAEKIQYETADVINVDSTLRKKWIVDYVDSHLEHKAIVNFNGVDSDLFSVDDIPVSKFTRFPESSLVVGVASSFRWYNDVDEMMKIFSLSAKANANLMFLVILGDPTKRQEINSSIAACRLENRVDVVEQIPFVEMPKYLNTCDILISHFNFHGKWPHNCSIKHMEYLAMGKPVVATDVGEVNYAVEHGVNGYLCPEGDIQAFTQAILELASDNRSRIKFGKAGRAKAVNELSWDQHVTKIISRLEAKIETT